MKICALTNTYNSEEYLWYVLKSIYGFFDRIVLIDGAFNDKMPSKVSTDTTAKIIRTFPQVGGKIRYESGPARTQLDQRQKVVKYLEGFDWLVIVDDDEIYKPKDMKTLRRFLDNTREDAFKIGGYTFFNSFDWYRWVADPRIWRVKEGMEFIGSNNLRANNTKYDRNKMKIVPHVVKYHYSYVRNVKRFGIRKRQTKIKRYPYEVKGGFFVRKDITPRKFTGEHPKIMKGHPYRRIKWNPS